MEHHAHHIKQFEQKFWISVVITLPILLLSSTVQELTGLTWIKIPYQQVVLLILSTIIYVYGGIPFLRGLAEEISQRQPGMMTLIGTAISVAFFYSALTVFVGTGTDFFWELATLIDIMLLGHWIEAKSLLGASRALEELVKIMPSTAHIINETGQTIDIPTSDLKPGDKVMVKPGEKVPSDGTVTEGESSVNEAFLTGESRPVSKSQGDKVTGGSINEEGSLTVRIEKTGQDTYLSQVIRLVKQAQESKSHTQDLANRAAALLFYVAVIVGIITYVAWTFTENSSAALERTVTVLVIACPHALGLAIPLVVALSTSLTAKNGILIRDRRAFELAKDIDAVVFDKTGTLTEGKFGVTEIIAYIPEADLLKYSAAIEIASEHTIAKAIVEHAKTRQIEFPRAEDFKAIPGKGACAKVDDKQICIGSQKLIEEMKLQTDDPRINALEAQGKTVIFTVIDGKIAGAIALSDKIRKESYEAVQQLKNAGSKVFMLTGDSEEVAASVAKELGVNEYFARVLPDQKSARIQQLKNRHLKVAMVGDGINDAPALVTADVGIAIGAGTDVAIESADIILVKNDPRDVPKAINLSRKTYSKMLQNLWWATGYNIVAIPLAAGILAGYGIILPPTIGALVMSLSTVIVSINSQTLRKYEPRTILKFAEEQPVLIDPVCGMQLTTDRAYSKLQYEGYTYYFCSEKCEQEFTKNPEKYTKKLKDAASQMMDHNAH